MKLSHVHLVSSDKLNNLINKQFLSFVYTKIKPSNDNKTMIPDPDSWYNIMIKEDQIIEVCEMMQPELKGVVLQVRTLYAQFNVLHGDFISEQLNHAL